MADFRRIASPPSGITGPLGTYLREIARAINDIPQLSAYSGVTPNGVVSGFPGDLTVNLTSSSTDKRLWQLGGTTRSTTSQGWVQV